MSRPRDGDGSSTEDGMVAQVIPLRRRGRETNELDRLTRAPGLSGLFDPPQDPEPLSEYSVWEKPTAELVRRETPDATRPAGTLAQGLRAHGLHVQRGLIAAATVGVIASVTVLAALTLSGHHRQPGLGVSRPGSSRTSASLSGGATAGRAKRAAPPGRPLAARTGRHHGRTANRSQHLGGAVEPNAVELASARSGGARVTVQEPPSTTPSPASAPTGQPGGESSPTASSASREFGFEH
jgi:hypothetical protein